jgi:hypothetical protein
MVQVRFAGCRVQQRGLRAGFWLKRRIDNPRFSKVEFIPPNNYVYSLPVRSPEDLDDEVRGRLAEAYRVGRQEHPSDRAPAAGRARRPTSPGPQGVNPTGGRGEGPGKAASGRRRVPREAEKGGIPGISTTS